MTLEEAGPDLVRCPFKVLIDTAEKAPWYFAGIPARSFVDKDLREYVVTTERRYLGIGMGDYSIEGLQDQVGIERKSMEDFWGTLLGWPHDISDPDACRELDPRKGVHRRGRFKVELQKLQALPCKAVVVEAPLEQCLSGVPQWGVRTAAENSKYLYSTYLAWSQEFAVPWYFAWDRHGAALTALRLLEKFWDRHRKLERERLRKERRQRAAASVMQPLFD
jgi:hypothetical protein